jgi:hypothetical protein
VINSPRDPDIEASPKKELQQSSATDRTTGPNHHTPHALSVFTLARVMSLHKLSAGDGYLYLIRQVAANDSTDRGREALHDYYSERGDPACQGELRPAARSKSAPAGRDSGLTNDVEFGAFCSCR